jgi:hypothetical protein
MTIPAAPTHEEYTSGKRLKTLVSKEEEVVEKENGGEKAVLLYGRANELLFFCNSTIHHIVVCVCVYNNIYICVL